MELQDPITDRQVSGDGHPGDAVRKVAVLSFVQA